MKDFEPVKALLRQATTNRVFPSAVVEVGTSHQVIWRESFGTLSYDFEAPLAAENTVFDLASLTKVIATTTLTMIQLENGALHLDNRIGNWLHEWKGSDRDNVTIRDLLAHTSGLTAHLPFFLDCSGRADFQQAICTMPLEYTPRTQSIYSDLGFILLGFIIEDAGGKSLKEQFENTVSRYDLGNLAFQPPHTWRLRTAPTEVDSWRGRLLVGEVHDQNAWALEGIAGHTGLFGEITSLGRFAQLILKTKQGLSTLVNPVTLDEFISRVKIPNSSRALGWDTMLPTSSCGTRMSPLAIGHTGFTGTSLWIDIPSDTYVSLLTNRVHPSRTNEQILAFRPAFHDGIMAVLGH